MRPAQLVPRAAGYLERHGVDSPTRTAELLLADTLGTSRSGLYLREQVLTAERMEGLACPRVGVDGGS